MQFEAMRDVKEEALARFGAVPGPRASTLRRATGVGATLVGAAASLGAGPLIARIGSARNPSVGLGVSLSGDGECKLAVRYPWLDRSRAPYLDELRELAEGQVDVDWTGPLVARASVGDWSRQRCRPLKIGSSVAHHHGTAGTVCAFVRRGAGAPELLSCNHVLADCGRAPANDAILQPGPEDGGGASDAIGRLAYVHPLHRGAVNVVDCALGALATGVDADGTTLDGFGSLNGVVDSVWYGPTAEGQQVAKIGRTTETTHGRVTTLSFSQFVNYPGFGRCYFDDLIEIRGDDGPFSCGGDSGSLVFVPDDRLGVGMVIADTPSHKSYATRFDTVLSQLAAQLVL